MIQLFWWWQPEEVAWFDHSCWKILREAILRMHILDAITWIIVEPQQMLVDIFLSCLWLGNQIQNKILCFLLHLLLGLKTLCFCYHSCLCVLCNQTLAHSFWSLCSELLFICLVYLTRSSGDKQPDIKTKHKQPSWSCRKGWVWRIPTQC